MRALNGWNLGGLTLDLSIADNRPVVTKGEPRRGGDRVPVKRERSRERGDERDSRGKLSTLSLNPTPKPFSLDLMP